jgi:peptidoglycan hydrolase FlgJ
MTIESTNASFYADPAGLADLKRGAADKSPEAIREAARQFESLFTTMMLKSMRDASPKDELFGSDQQDFYQDMFDQQMSMQLSKGKGLGLADMLVRQLMQGVDAEQLTKNPALAPLSAAGGAGQPATTAVWPPRSREEFVQAVLPSARVAAAQLGVDPEVVVAHAALETGWGRSTPVDAAGKPSFNLFGIKADASWTGAAADSPTQEFSAGRMQEVTASFRAYATPEHSMQDYADFLKSSPRYATALNTGGDAAAFARGLQRGGYATDPDYVTKLTTIAAQLKSQAGMPIPRSSAG